MSAQLYPWVIIGHLVGIALWAAGLVTTIALLRVHHGADAASRPGVLGTARRMALLMDLGATLAIALGLFLAFASPRYPSTAFQSGGWLHVKLMLVVVGLLIPHGILRATIGALRRGRTKVAPRGLLAVVLGCAVGCIVLGAHPTLLRKAPSAPTAPVPVAPAG
ncbi:MAG: CopD family protein [Kofleriaceae bacterium]